MNFIFKDLFTSKDIYKELGFDEPEESNPGFFYKFVGVRKYNQGDKFKIHYITWNKDKGFKNNIYTFLITTSQDNTLDYPNNNFSFNKDDIQISYDDPKLKNTGYIYFGKNNSLIFDLSVNKFSKWKEKSKIKYVGRFKDDIFINLKNLCSRNQNFRSNFNRHRDNVLDTIISGDISEIGEDDRNNFIYKYKL